MMAKDPIAAGMHMVGGRAALHIKEHISQGCIQPVSLQASGSKLVANELEKVHSSDAATITL